MRGFILHLNTKSTILCFFLLIALVSCAEYPNEIQNSLDYAGDNKIELIKVLNHYSHKPKDSLKHKAALFLIGNMYNHTFHPPLEEFDGIFDSIEKYPESVIRRDIFRGLLDSVSKSTKADSNESVLFDLQNLKSDFIINNIELAFNSWYKIPKDKRASFEDFCNYILPYRSTNEPIEFNSRKKLFNKYSWVYDYLDKGADFRFIVDSLKSEINFSTLNDINKYYPIPLSISQMEKCRMGLCDDGVNYFVNIFRALGIICAKDMVMHWGNHHSNGHSWIYLKYGNEEYSTNIQGRDDLKIKFKKESVPKIYRKTFAFQHRSNIDPLTIDVTDTYVRTIDLMVENIFDVSISEPVICVFDRNREWVTVDIGISQSNQHVLYENMGVNVLYFSASLEGKQLTPVNYPFYLDKNKEIHFFKPIRTKQDSIVLSRKYGLSSPRDQRKINWLKSLDGGFFEGSNSVDFKKAVKLYEISNLLSTQINQVTLKTGNKFKYIRFNSNGKKSWLSRLAFYDKKGNLLTGSITKENTVNLIWENGAFDHDPLTFSGGENFRLGLKLDEPKSIGLIEFQSRNDDNHINIGEDYELFYWDKDWQSLGIQKAKDTALYYKKVPGNALLWLRNHTKGKEEHVFTIDENKRQKWLGFDNY